MAKGVYTPMFQQMHEKEKTKLMRFWKPPPPLFVCNIRLVFSLPIPQGFVLMSSRFPERQRAFARPFDQYFQLRPPGNVLGNIMGIVMSKERMSERKTSSERMGVGGWNEDEG
ncbi:hypothetical protein MLD38_020468 [Melastoma candidum]|uniref:Uncharacterized protein n=1 Tax=Melastoma candidum TaxID=119954 RepID=A0ACB9QCG8_9MYRT|nr:hypothetical protein MLD38_020468 [Melastoma candidum]